MVEFNEFIEKRFGYDNVEDTNVSNTTKPASATSEDIPISDTPANQAFMARFCEVY